jgi:hypothetical protein
MSKEKVKNCQYKLDLNQSFNFPFMLIWALLSLLMNE